MKTQRSAAGIRVWVTMAGSLYLALPASHVLALEAAPVPVESQGRSLERELALKITTPFTLAAVGDIIEPQPLYSQAPGFQQLVNLIRNADAGFGNM